MGGKALLIKGVDFGSQKLTTVNYTEGVPCTGLSLNETTKTMTAVGSSFTLIPTKEPLNTTDTVYWSTSNANIATVADGIVTQTGVGTVVITATCGNQTATCTITATNVLTFNYALRAAAIQRPPTSGGVIRDYGYCYNNNEHYAAIYNGTTPTSYRLQNTADNVTQQYAYPIKIGAGATTITADVPDSIRFTIWFLDSETMCEYGDVEPTAVSFAKVISGDESEYDSHVALGDRTVSVPQGADSIICSLHKPGTGNSVSDADVALVTITAS